LSAEFGLQNAECLDGYLKKGTAMQDIASELKQRTKQFGLRIVRLVRSLDGDGIERTIANQLLRCGTSVGANYRAACRARSPAEFRAKLGIVEEEADECAYWMELLVESGIVAKSLLEDLLKETDEILAIIVSSITTSKRNN
jgi:four helix bundle protein